MPNTPVIGRAVSLVADEPEDTAVRAREAARLLRVSLDPLHREALAAFLAEAPSELASLAADTATALGVGSDRERSDARIRLAARMISVHRVQAQSLELALAEAVNRRDERGAALIGRVLDGMTRRLGVWLEEHRLSCSIGQRSVTVAIGAANAVSIAGER